MKCHHCNEDGPQSKGMTASNGIQTVWLCAECVMKQSNGYEVMDDLS